MAYVLIFLATMSSSPVYLGEFADEYSCRQAIRTVFEMKISPTERDNPAVQRAVDQLIQYQQEYRCIPKSTPSQQ